MGVHHADADHVGLTDELPLARLRNDVLGGAVLELSPVSPASSSDRRGQAASRRFDSRSRRPSESAFGERCQLRAGGLFAYASRHVPSTTSRRDRARATKATASRPTTPADEQAASVAPVGVLEVVARHPAVVLLPHGDSQPVRLSTAGCCRSCRWPSPAPTPTPSPLAGVVVLAFERSTVDHRFGAATGVPEDLLEVLGVIGPARACRAAAHWCCRRTVDAVVDGVLVEAEHVHHELRRGVDEPLVACLQRFGVMLLCTEVRQRTAVARAPRPGHRQPPPRSRPVCGAHAGVAAAAPCDACGPGRFSSTGFSIRTVVVSAAPSLAGPAARTHDGAARPAVGSESVVRHQVCLGSIIRSTQFSCGPVLAAPAREHRGLPPAGRRSYRSAGHTFCTTSPLAPGGVTADGGSAAGQAAVRAPARRPGCGTTGGRAR